VEHHALFPKRTNAEFARLLEPDLIELVVWERGAGLTQACGTGACATVVAAALTNRIAAGKLVRVRLPGGELRIRLEPDFSRVWMTGPAVEVFSGATT
jgi:diaminopimelate epimerase